MVEYHGPPRGDAYAIPFFLPPVGKPPPDCLTGNRLLHFLSRRTRTPTVLEGFDAAGLAAFKKADETVFVAYLDLDVHRSSAGVFEDVARGLRDEFSFGIVGDKEVARREGVETPAVVCYKKGDGDVTMGGPLEVGRLLNWCVCFLGGVGGGERLTCNTGLGKRRGRLLES